MHTMTVSFEPHAEEIALEVAQLILNRTAETSSNEDDRVALGREVYEALHFAYLSTKFKGDK